MPRPSTISLMLYIKSVLLMLLGPGLIGVILQIWPGGGGEGRGGEALSAPLGSESAARLGDKLDE